jgi:hypothetical protein
LDDRRKIRTRRGDQGNGGSGGGQEGDQGRGDDGKTRVQEKFGRRKIGTITGEDGKEGREKGRMLTWRWDGTERSSWLIVV